MRDLRLAHLLADFRHEGLVELSAEFRLVVALAGELASLLSMSSSTSNNADAWALPFPCLLQYLQQYMVAWCFVTTGVASVLLCKNVLGAGMCGFMT